MATQNAQEKLSQMQAEFDIRTRIFRNETTLYKTIERLAKNQEVKVKTPNFHTLLTSMHNFERTRGELTRAQKKLISSQIEKQIPFIVTLSTKRVEVVKTSAEDEAYMDRLADDDSRE